MSKEASARIKINKLLENSGWRFFDDENGRANIVLENNIKITEKLLNDLEEDFEKTTNGFIDYLLLDHQGFPLIVLEAKKESVNPLFAKEQARKYANAQNCRFVILTNGNQHYLWDLKRGNPNLISRFPTPDTIEGYSEFQPDTKDLINEKIETDFVAKTQNPDFDKDPRWRDSQTKDEFIFNSGLRFLRHYQLRAVHRIQEEVKAGKDRFLFEMATGTGKTLTASAVIKLFLKTRNASRVLFLVDRIELEQQAEKDFKDYLKNDFSVCIYKDNRDDWRKSEVVISTVQSLLSKNKYKRLFSPTDFNLVISDEAHRSINGNSRLVFEHFVGYKLGLTATPKDYLKKIDSEALSEKDPRELERRMLLDTYSTFGCEDGKPTFQYSLVDGVKDGFLINPIVVDARTEITTQLLSDKGYNVVALNDEGEQTDTTYTQKDFEKNFFSKHTNTIFCKTFLENALLDPITGEIGKTIIFAVRQNHASKIVQLLNEMAMQMFPDKYESDFAVQVTSVIPDAQKFTVNFKNNNLNGSGNFSPFYKTSKTRVCVTVGMMTTGYDCPDILNVVLMRPIYSPTDFIQIKGRGTRKHNFTKELKDEQQKKLVLNPDKKAFKLFDFFAVCEYFETKFNYDEILELPAISSAEGGGDSPPVVADKNHEYILPDPLKTMRENQIGADGMRIDRMYFERFEDVVKEDKEIQKMVQNKDLDAIEKYIVDNVFEKPNEYYNLPKLREAAKVDRRLSLREIIEKMFGYIPYFKSKDELLEEEFDKFDSAYLPEEAYFEFAKNYFKSYITDAQFRDIIENKNFALLNTNANGDSFKKLSPELRTIIPEYIKDNVSINQFMS